MGAVINEKIYHGKQKDSITDLNSGGRLNE